MKPLVTETDIYGVIKITEMNLGCCVCCPAYDICVSDDVDDFECPNFNCVCNKPKHLTCNGLDFFLRKEVVMDADDGIVKGCIDCEFGKTYKRLLPEHPVYCEYYNCYTSAYSRCDFFIGKD